MTSVWPDYANYERKPPAKSRCHPRTHRPVTLPPRLGGGHRGILRVEFPLKSYGISANALRRSRLTPNEASGLNRSAHWTDTHKPLTPRTLGLLSQLITDRCEESPAERLRFVSRVRLFRNDLVHYASRQQLG